MKVEYDNYYQTENLFGAPYPELIALYASFEEKGKLLDLGCGQGRDAIALAKLGYEVTGVDNSKVGIDQLNRIAKDEHLPLTGVVADIFNYARFNEFDFILMDSMFHFGKKERTKEIQFLNRIMDESKPKTLITTCIQRTGKKVDVFNAILSARKDLELVSRKSLVYTYEDKASNHRSETEYEMVSVRKLDN